VTCISHDLAARFCAKQGKTLPSEAEFEFLASGLRGARFPWGNDLPSCTDAVYARVIDAKLPDLAACISLGEGTRPKGSGLRDFLRLADGDVFDLAGNASEMTRDSYQPLEGECWSHPFLVDPACARGGTVFVRRGGGVESRSGTLRATVREQLDAKTGYANVGFRCVRPGL
jgi:formylglycine-generating enzyme required for sulfatase activity